MKSTTTGFYKIGFSSNPAKRLQQLQTGCPDQLELISVYPSRFAPKIEGALHNRYVYLKIHHEWFDLGLEEELSFLTECEKIEKNLLLLENF